MGVVLVRAELAGGAQRVEQPGVVGGAADRKPGSNRGFVPAELQANRGSTPIRLPFVSRTRRRAAATNRRQATVNRCKAILVGRSELSARRLACLRVAFVEAETGEMLVSATLARRRPCPNVADSLQNQPQDQPIPALPSVLQETRNGHYETLSSTGLVMVGAATNRDCRHMSAQRRSAGCSRV